MMLKRCQRCRGNHDEISCLQCGHLTILTETKKRPWALRTPPAYHKRCFGRCNRLERHHLLPCAGCRGLGWRCDVCGSCQGCEIDISIEARRVEEVV